MADEAFDGAALAIGVQTAFGTPNATIAGLSGTVDSSDGFVRGIREAGDAESGITLPDLVGEYLEKPAVAASFTEAADSFKRALVNGLSIVFPLQGSGAVVSSTPGAGEAAPLVGIDAILQSAGLIGANGTAPVVAFTPRHAGSSGGSTIYSTIKLWHGDLSLVFTDCLVETLGIEFTPGGNGLVTAGFRVGSHDPSSDFTDGVTFPDIDYTTQDSLAAPVVAGITFNAFGQTAGAFDDGFTVSIQNEIEEFGDSSVPVTGRRQSQTRRVITVGGTIYVVAADSDAEYQNLVASAAPTDDLSFQLGTVAGGDDTANAALIEVNNLQNKQIKYDRRGDALAVTLSGAKATGTTAGSEFSLTFN